MSFTAPNLQQVIDDLTACQNLLDSTGTVGQNLDYLECTLEDVRRQLHSQEHSAYTSIKRARESVADIVSQSLATYKEANRSQISRILGHSTNESPSNYIDTVINDNQQLNTYGIIDIEGIETISTLRILRANARRARDTIRSHLQLLIPKEHSLADFTRKSLPSTIDRLDGQLHERRISLLRSAASAYSYTISRMNKVSARIGEIGGEQKLTSEGYTILPSFQVRNAGTPPANRLDCVAINEHTNSIVVAEFKGCTSNLSKTPVDTIYGKRLQGSIDYFKDKLANDSRFISELRKNPELWNNIKDKKITFTAWVTRTSETANTKFLKAPKTFTLDPTILSIIDAKLNTASS